MRLCWVRNGEHSFMKPVYFSNETLKAVPIERLTPTQQSFVKQKLSGMSCRSIAQQSNVSVQYVYKVLRQAVSKNNYTGTEPKYAALSRPRQQCVYKNLALVMTYENVKMCDISTRLMLKSGCLSSVLYERKPMPLDIALRIHSTYFPEIDIEYLFSKDYSHTACPAKVSLDNVLYPKFVELVKASDAVSLEDIATFLDTSYSDFIDKLSNTGNKGLTFTEAKNIQRAFFPTWQIDALFSMVKCD